MFRRAFLLTAAAVMISALVPSQARAAEDKVRFFVDVVYASGQGTEVDPPSLESMKQAFSKDFTFTSFKRLSTQILELDAKVPQTLVLPNGSKAQFQLVKLEKGVAHVNLTVAKVTTQIELGKKASIYAAAGTHQQGVLVLAVSPITQDKGRRDGK